MATKIKTTTKQLTLINQITMAIVIVPFKLAGLGNTTLIRNTAAVYPPISGNGIEFNIAISPLLTLFIIGKVIITSTPSGDVYSMTDISHSVQQGPTTMTQAMSGYFQVNDFYWKKLYQAIAPYVASLKQV